jgi:Protein of unknown function (DUF4038)/Putative collagen-binding domain of a collagenase
MNRIIASFTVLFTLIVLSTITYAAPIIFPFQVSGDLRYLVDDVGKPVLIHGDSSWSIIVQLDTTGVLDYLDDRRNKGFNALVVNLIESHFSNNPPKNVFGQGPFTTPGNFATPNEAYFAHVDWILQKAEERGILVLLNPAYMGHPNNGQNGASIQGWYSTIVANGPSKNRSYGQWLGNRYKPYNNIIWIWAGDQVPAVGSTGVKYQLEILKGIKETAPDHLHTAHFKRTTTALEHPDFAPHMDLDLNYSKHFTYLNAQRAYTRTNFLPTFLYEAYYEGSTLTPTSRSLIRAQAYWANLTGSTGQVFGQDPLWRFKSNWRSFLNTSGTKDMTHVLAVFQDKPWHTLVPDFNHSVVTSGFGTFGGSTYVTAARSSSGGLVMAYIPSTGTGAKSITVNMAKLSSSVSGRWYNPTSGVYTTISGSPLKNAGSRTFTTPGNNGTGTNDWLLLLQADLSVPL